MDELALFAGAGGGILGGHLLGWRTVCAVEKEPYCREVLLRRQRDGVLPLFPIWDDIRTFDGKPWRGLVDVVSAGFPCQPFSVAGRRRGEADERNMWPETLRVLSEVRPPLAFMENVPGLLGNHGYFGRILGDLAEIGFDAQWDCIPASACGAPHQRDRLWILAHTVHWARQEPQREPWCKGSSIAVHDGETRDVANPQGTRLEGAGKKLPTLGRPFNGRRWPPESDVGRIARHGLAHRVDRLKAIGNGQVSRVAARACMLLMNRLAQEVIDFSEAR